MWIIVIFLSAVWTLVLTAPIHCRGSIAEQVKISSNLSNINKLNCILDDLRVTAFSENYFWVNYFFKAGMKYLNIGCVLVGHDLLDIFR